MTVNELAITTWVIAGTIGFWTAAFSLVLIAWNLSIIVRLLKRYAGEK